MACLIWLGGTFFAVILNVAVAELIKLFIDVEHNTRVAAMSAAASATGGTSVATMDNGIGGRLNEETAEGALIRGH